MRILFVPYGTKEAPATRYRVIQYLPYLRGMGIAPEVFYAISRFSTNLMIRSPDFGPAAKFLYYLYISIERFFRLIYVITISRNYDIVFLQRTTFPLRMEALLKALNDKIIFDIDDAIYLPDKEANDVLTRIKRYVKKSEVVNILKASKTVIVENEYIKNFVARYCDNVLKIPGPIDTEHFFVRPRPENAEDLVIGWIGSPATTFYLHMLDNVFKAISRRYDRVRFKFIGLGRYANRDIAFEKVAWDPDTEVAHLQTFDIGLMPMPDNEWTRGKLGCKMLQYMAVGIPAVVSYTSTNAEIITDGESGFFAGNEEEWIKVLSALIEDKELRRRIGGNARRTIVDKCSLKENIARLRDAFQTPINT